MFWFRLFRGSHTLINACDNRQVFVVEVRIQRSFDARAHVFLHRIQNRQVSGDTLDDISRIARGQWHDGARHRLALTVWKDERARCSSGENFDLRLKAARISRSMELQCFSASCTSIKRVTIIDCCVCGRYRLTFFVRSIRSMRISNLSTMSE